MMQAVAPGGFEPQQFRGHVTLDQFLELTDTDRAGYKSLRRRGQLPLIPSIRADNLWLSQRGVPIPDSMPPEWDARGWSPFMVLSLILAHDLVEQYKVDRDFAAKMVGDNIYGVGPHWPQISDGSQKIAAFRYPLDTVPRHQRPVHVMLSYIEDVPELRVEKAKSAPFDPHVVIGTLRDILNKYPTAGDIIAVSITAAVAKMRQRAAKAKIDLSEFFKDLGVSAEIAAAAKIDQARRHK